MVNLLNTFYIYITHFILGGYYVLIVFILHCKTLLLLLRWDTGKVRHRFGGMGGFKGGLRCKEWVNSVIINVIAEMNCKCNYMQVFKNI